MTKREALEKFRREYPLGCFSPGSLSEGVILDRISRDIDRLARAKAWNEFTSLLYCKGKITPQQRGGWKNPFEKRRTS